MQNCARHYLLLVARFTTLLSPLNMDIDDSLQKHANVSPCSLARSTAKLLGAPMASIIANPDRIDFWTRSNEALPETTSMQSLGGAESLIRWDIFEPYQLTFVYWVPIRTPSVLCVVLASIAVVVGVRSVGTNGVPPVDSSPPYSRKIGP